MSGPAGVPFSVMLVHSLLIGGPDVPKQPGVPGVPPWPGQKMPVALVTEVVPVVSGERWTGIGPTCDPSRQASFPGDPAMQVQGELPVPLGQFEAPELPPVRQSRVRPTELVDVQARPARGPRSQRPVAGELGLPLTGTPPERHRGQGWDRLPVR